MKHLLHLSYAIALLFVSANAFGQCAPNPAFSGANNGIFPYGPIMLDCSGQNADLTVVGMAVDTTSTISFPNPGTEIDIYFEATRIDTIIGLPAGLIVETDVMGSATTQSPYGVWQYAGSLPQYDGSFGCMRISGSPSTWSALSTGGPNGDGVYPITIVQDYKVAYTDPDVSFIVANGTWITESALFVGDTIEKSLDVNGSACGANFFITPQVTANTDTSQGCDGSVTTEVYGGQPPYTYNYSMGNTTQTVNGLCPGTYLVQVTDANGTSGTAQFAVGVISNVYSNVNPNGLPLGTDSLFFSYNTCDLDYNLPIDSFEVVNALAAGNDTLAVEWVIYQQGNPYNVLSFYPDGNPDPTVLSLVLFCENGRAQTGVFQLYAYVDPAIVTGVEEQTQTVNFSIMPNPTNGLLTLRLDAELKDGQVEVYDPTGKLTHTESLSGVARNEINLQHLPDGLYTVRFIGQNGFGVKRIVKAGGLR